MKATLPLVLLLLLVARAPLPAQDTSAPISEACSAAAFRAFDYWLGSWDVFNAEGRRVGHNEITRVSDGCAIEERWTSSTGTTGTSLNFFASDTGLWNQVWVGGSGQLLHLSGGLEDGVMTLSGIRETPSGEILDRIRWIPRDGEVEQLWEVSDDGGETWRTTFRGFYRPARPPEGS